jgi:hypothetical protein
MRPFSTFPPNLLLFKAQLKLSYQKLETKFTTHPITEFSPRGSDILSLRSYASNDEVGCEEEMFSLLESLLLS